MSKKIKVKKKKKKKKTFFYEGTNNCAMCIKMCSPFSFTGTKKLEEDTIMICNYIFNTSNYYITCQHGLVMLIPVL